MPSVGNTAKDLDSWQPLNASGGSLLRESRHQQIAEVAVLLPQRPCRRPLSGLTRPSGNHYPWSCCVPGVAGSRRIRCVLSLCIAWEDSFCRVDGRVQAVC